MEKQEIKIGDIVMAKYGNSVFTFTKEDGSTAHCNIGIWGIVTDITLKKTKQDGILVKLMFDATSFYTYKPEEIEVICSTNLVKNDFAKITLAEVYDLYRENSICMAELLASIPATGLSVEEVFYMFVHALKWSDKDRFFRHRDINDIEDSDNYNFDQMVLSRFGNKEELIKRIEAIGAKVLSIKQANELEDIGMDGILNMDQSLIAELGPGDEGKYSRLTLFYYIDRRGSIVITETNFSWE